MRATTKAGLILAAAGAVALVGHGDQAQQKAAEQRRRDVSKESVEAPLKLRLSKKPRFLRADRAKGAIEQPIRRSLGSAQAARPERVAPGAVRWHASFDTARAAAKKSGKPVLLFQLLGALDQRFC